jgi:hypothetical protein
MTILAPDRTAGMSVVEPTFKTQKEVKQMTTATATDLDLLLSTTRDGVSRQSRPSAIDRAVMRLSVAMLRWARNHANRSFRTWDELSLSNRNALEREARESAPGLAPLRLL